MGHQSEQPYAERDHLRSDSLVELDFVGGRDVPTHRHENIELLFAVAGEVELAIEGDECRLAAGGIVLVNARHAHGYRATEDAVIARFLISNAKMRELLGTTSVLFWCNSTADRNEAYGSLRRVIAQVLNEVVCNGSDNKLYLSSLYYQLLYMLAENFILSPDDERFVDRAEDGDRMAQIDAYLRENYRDKVSLQDLADLLYLSPSYVSKYVKQQSGHSFYHLLNSIRLARATEDMLYTDDPITKIALDNGFASVAAFDKVFKEAYGQTPSEFRGTRREASDARGDADGPWRQQVHERVRGYLEHNDVGPDDAATCRLGVSVKMGDPACGRWNGASNRVMSVGTALDLLGAQVQRQVLEARDELGYEYVRFWGVFDADLYLDVHAPGERRNYGRLDAAIDFLVHNHLKPYVDLGFKSNRILRTTTEVVRDLGPDSPFGDGQEMERFFSDLFRHFVKRYGSREVRTWYFEYWERPEEDAKSSGTLQYALMDDERHRRYFSQFDAVARALRSQLPDARIGGAGFPVRVYGREAFSRILSLWSTFEQLPDFITISCYPYQQEKVGGSYYEKRSSDLGFVRHGIEIAEDAMGLAGLPAIPIHVSEFNLTLSNRNAINDSCLKAAYLVSNAIDCLGKSDFVGHVALTDYTVEERDVGSVLFGGSGLLTSDGIAKPAYSALEYLGRLYPDVQSMGKNLLVTRNPRGSLRLVCHNLKKPNYNYYRVEEDDLDIESMSSIMSDTERLSVSLGVRGLHDGTYTVKTNLVNGNHGGIQERWLDMGTEDPTAKEMEYLRLSSLGEMFVRRYEVQGGCLDLQWEMEPNEIRYLHIYRG